MSLKSLQRDDDESVALTGPSHFPLALPVPVPKPGNVPVCSSGSAAPKSEALLLGAVGESGNCIAIIIAGRALCCLCGKPLLGCAETHDANELPVLVDLVGFRVGVHAEQSGRRDQIFVIRLDE